MLRRARASPSTAAEEDDFSNITPHGRPDTTSRRPTLRIDDDDDDDDDDEDYACGDDMTQQQTRCKSTATQASNSLTTNKRNMLAGAHHKIPREAARQQEAEARRGQRRAKTSTCTPSPILQGVLIRTCDEERTRVCSLPAPTFSSRSDPAAGSRTIIETTIS